MARKKAASSSATLFEAPVASRTLAEEVESAFLDYSMSVIVSRALPDVRDGLKPVHRRILWAMHDAGLRPDRPFVKCARVVGDVMGRFHPHGDTAIYDALVRLGQDFSLSNPLIDKHGNFGSPADPPAAQRYTECRLSLLATEMLAGIDEGTVDFEPSYDASDEEPVVLPSRFPNLLVNGNQGIAVGMATNIPPHNLGEICDAALLLIERPETTLDALMKVVRGPDFPTGALIMGSDGIADAYRTGRGSIRLRAVTSIETARKGPVIVITEIPYQSSVDAIAGKLAEAVESGRIEGVRDIRNESGQGSTRLVVELRADANPQIVLNNIFKHTPAQTAYGINMVALVDGVPAHGQPRAGAAGVGRSPGGGRHPAHAAPARQGRGPAPHHRGSRQGARPDRRDRRADQGVEGSRRGPNRADGEGVRVQRDPGQPHPRSRPRSADAARSRRARQGGEGPQGRGQEAAADPRQARRAHGRDPRRADRDPRRTPLRPPHPDRRRRSRGDRDGGARRRRADDA